MPRFVPDLARKVQPQKTTPYFAAGALFHSLLSDGAPAILRSEQLSFAHWLLMNKPPDPSDNVTMTAIYHHHVLQGIASFEIDPPSIADIKSRMMVLLAKEYPVLITETYDGVIVGYAGPHKTKGSL